MIVLYFPLYWQLNRLIRYWLRFHFDGGVVCCDLYATFLFCRCHSNSKDNSFVLFDEASFFCVYCVDE